MLPSGGQLLIRVEDSGQGFDFKEKEIAADNSMASSVQNKKGYFGRGIALVRSLCKSVSYQGNGNCVEAFYVWSMDASEFGRQ